MCTKYKSIDQFILCKNCFQDSCNECNNNICSVCELPLICMMKCKIPKARISSIDTLKMNFLRNICFWLCVWHGWETANWGHITDFLLLLICILHINFIWSLGQTILKFLVCKFTHVLGLCTKHEFDFA